ncbi:MAG: cysteine desulfurase family protein [Eubacteriales bacterium]|nr:cysteine desulfurase family protein [Eubacteriales bacterium]
MQVYLDNSATTKPCEAAVEAVTKAMREEYYNPSALYAHAVQAERALEKARGAIAAAVDANPENVVFTSGGTESDNLAILGYLAEVRGSSAVLYSAAEHPAVKNACLEAASRYGCTAREIPLDARGSLDLEKFRERLNPEVKLICVMQVCNETGVIMPLEKVVALRDELAPQAAIHVDGVQGFLRVPFSLRKLNVQSYAVSAHKIHGPKGVGALMVQDKHRLHPQLFGGGQQNGLRSGTENTAAIAGFAAAVTRYPAIGETQAKLSALKRVAVETLAEQIPGFRILGPGVEEPDSAPHILYASFPPVRAETMVHALEATGVYTGTGSACSSHKSKRSDVLTAMGIPPAVIDSAVRLSFSVDNTEEEIRYAVEQIAKQYAILARFTRR